jgi:hypothetical protein
MPAETVRMTKTDEKWLERIRRWQESGKTAEEFTLGQSYKASTLKWRAADLRRQAEGAARYGQTSARSSASAKSIRLARVVTRGGPRAAGPSVGMVVEVSGARISVARGFDAELFADVVRALASGGSR